MIEWIKADNFMMVSKCGKFKIHAWKKDGEKHLVYRPWKLRFVTGTQGETFTVWEPLSCEKLTADAAKVECK